MGLKTHKIGRPANALAQWCISWCRQLGACVRSPDVNPRGIICLLDDAVLGVQAPRKEPLEEPAARSFFGGAGPWHYDAPDHEMAAALLVLWRLFLSIGGK